MKKYTDRERKLVRNVRKLLDMLTDPSLYTLLTEREYKMVNKIKQEIKAI
jgi:hypothetical protein